MEYKEAIKIDPDRLDLEFLKQTQLLADFGEQLADAKEETRKAEQRTKLIRSKLILLAKNGGAEAECGTKKPSDSVCEAFYRTHPEHVEAVEERIQAQSVEDHLQQAVFAISARRYMLENLVRLLLNDYFSGPAEAFEDTAEFDYAALEAKAKAKAETRKETTERMVSKRRRKK